MDATKRIETTKGSLHWGVQIMLHLGATMLVAGAIALLLLPLQSLKLIASVQLSNPDIFSASLPPLLLHLGLSACLWALVVILYQLWRRPRLRPLHRLGRVGSVMTETLIVLPIFFLLTFGMAQLAVNNVGGILANVAVYQAARAAWIWHPEIEVERVDKTVTEDDARNRMRIAAALVMTPVAPGGYLHEMEDNDAFERNQIAMAAGQVPLASAMGMDDFLGYYGIPNFREATRNNQSFSDALDSSSFLRRTLLKFNHAYQATEVTLLDEEGRIGVELTYKLHQVMPLVGRIFGEMDTVSARRGFFSTFSRSYSFRAQPYKPNPKLPDETFTGEQAEDNNSFDDVNFDNPPEP